MDDLNIAEGAVVADLGAGGGWFTIQLAPVAQNGLVYAEDVQPAMLDAIRRRAQRETYRTSARSSARPTIRSCLTVWTRPSSSTCITRWRVRRNRRATSRWQSEERRTSAQAARPARHRRFLPRRRRSRSCARRTCRSRHGRQSRGGRRVAARQEKSVAAVPVQHCSCSAIRRPHASCREQSASGVNHCGQRLERRRGHSGGSKTFAALGVYGTSAITAVTAQSTSGSWTLSRSPPIS